MWLSETLGRSFFHTLLLSGLCYVWYSGTSLLLPLGSFLSSFYFLFLNVIYLDRKKCFQDAPMFLHIMFFDVLKFVLCVVLALVLNTALFQLPF